ncbi:MAG: hypothetical protein AAB420_01360 [Patescibacteria group bacterium]
MKVRTKYPLELIDASDLSDARTHLLQPGIYTLHRIRCPFPFINSQWWVLEGEVIGKAARWWKDQQVIGHLELLKEEGSTPR